jgi:hypothetical protein
MFEDHAAPLSHATDCAGEQCFAAMHNVSVINFSLGSSRGMVVASWARQKFLRKRTESSHRSERGKSAEQPARLQI